MNDTTLKSIDILLVEDNPGDADLAREALQESLRGSRLFVVSDGEKAMAFLRRQGAYPDAPRPDLVLLDLNLPRKDGRDVLAELKADAHLKRIPVVVLTTSRTEEDVLKCYNLHANCYVVKPLDVNQFMHVIKAIQMFWMTIAVLPPKEDADE